MSYFGFCPRKEEEGEEKATSLDLCAVVYG
jgi:hypothetical protein